MAYKRVSECRLCPGERWGNGMLITFPTSIRYNGGTIVDGKWYDGFKVVKPKVPHGYELAYIAILDQLNAQPPYATRYLRPKDGKKKTLSQLKQAIHKSNEYWDRKRKPAPALPL